MTDSEEEWYDPECSNHTVILGAREEKNESKSNLEIQQNLNELSLEEDVEADHIEKSLEEAQRLKESGNKLFGEGRVNEAVDIYNSALRYLPQEQEHNDLRV